MSKSPTWTCDGCGYTWKQPVGAVPDQPGCPACGQEHQEVVAAIAAAKKGA